jgi:hypothetical protein
MASNAFRATTLLVLLASGASAHSWLEQMQVIGPNGSYIGDGGYSRGFVGRDDPGFDSSFAVQWLLPKQGVRIDDTMFACHTSQRTSNYTEKYPSLKVAPGSYVAMKYYENGHVTQPWIPAGKPQDSGTVWVFGTYSPSPTEKIVDVLNWTTDGTGGNGKGWLMTAQSFDDGRCHQLNTMPISIDRQMNFPDRVAGQPNSNVEQLCETDLHIPANAKIGEKLTTYWVWSWDTAAHTEGVPCGKDEYYTTCSDFDVIDGGDSLASIAAMPFVHTAGQQDPQTVAVSDYQSRTALTATPVVITDDSCSITGDAASWYTTSSVPASITIPTTMPSSYQAPASGAAVPSYSPNAPAAAAGASSEPMPSTPQSAFSAPAVTSAPASTSASAVTSAPVSSSNSAQSNVSISFQTITIYGSSPPAPLTSITSANAMTSVQAANAVVSNDGVVSEQAGSARFRHARDFAGRL